MKIKRNQWGVKIERGSYTLLRDRITKVSKKEIRNRARISKTRTDLWRENQEESQGEEPRGELLGIALFNSSNQVRVGLLFNCQYICI